MFPSQDKKSFLFITIDSCRYDTFAKANAPHLKSVGALYKAMAPGNFTYSSHAAMFMGFTPGIATIAKRYVNPKYGKIFKMVNVGFPGKGTEYITLEGRNIIDGLKKIGYRTLGTAGVGWFDTNTETGKRLTEDFDTFYFSGNTYSLNKQLMWISEQLSKNAQPSFVFLNIGETHVPYYFEGAPWDKAYNPCVPFSPHNNAQECQRRQSACLEYIDRAIAPLVDAFQEASIIICADHGDCWGEDGLWEHGIHHEKVLEVPLIIRLHNTNHSTKFQ